MTPKGCIILGILFLYFMKADGQIRRPRPGGKPFYGPFSEPMYDMKYERQPWSWMDDIVVDPPYRPPPVRPFGPRPFGSIPFGPRPGLSPYEAIPDVFPNPLKEIRDNSNECRYDGDLIAAHKCGSYYKCVAAVDDDDEETFRKEKSYCPDNKSFDSKKRKCVSKQCKDSKTKQRVLPPGWKCEAAGQFNVNPLNCHQFYKCENCTIKSAQPGDWCIKTDYTCPEGQNFDDSTKQCVTSTICPQRMRELPKENNFTCDADGKETVHPLDCTRYYTCMNCSKPGGWCYQDNNCPPDTYYDNIKQSCIPSDICPQDWEEIPKETGWSCHHHLDTHVVPTNCSEYYTCHTCDRARKWCVTRHKCQEGHTYDEKRKYCVRARCPQFPAILAANWTCSKELELRVNPADCRKFYTCLKCPDDNPWCSESGKCRAGQWFDGRLQKCVKHRKCPQDDKELPESASNGTEAVSPGNDTEPAPEGWRCENPGEIHVLPTDCRKYYECYRCSFASGWCMDVKICPAGQTFDEVLGLCTPGKCPQAKRELPKETGWVCDSVGDLHVVPKNSTGNCSKYYECEACSKPGGWCYNIRDCPEGENFDEEQKSCVFGKCPQDPDQVPDIFNCTKDGEVNQDPNSCTKYYKCINTGAYYTYTSGSCPDNLFFDAITKECVSGPCPQELIEIGDDWPKCSGEGEMHVFPSNCTDYYQCLTCSKPKKWCYEKALSCPKGEFFDEITKECVSGSCPQTRPEITEEMTCTETKESHSMKDDCGKYYECHRCDKPKGWCYNELTCPKGQKFNDATGVCQKGRCPQWPPKVPTIPTGGKCEADGDEFAFPDNCRNYFTCLKCEDGWCYNDTKTCPDDLTFDNTNKSCISGRCKQYPELVPDEWVCPTKLNKFSVHPQNCNSSFACVKCPDMPDQMCYREVPCPPEQSFDNTKKKCVPGRCPQLLAVLPEDYTCNYDGEVNVDPKDCTKHYTCSSSCPDVKWCYTSEKCDSGTTYNNMTKKCVPGSCPQSRPELPVNTTGWLCGAEEELHVLPGDCSSYYSCHKCLKGSGWCYEKLDCPPQEVFNENSKACQTGRCPQYPQKVPKNLSCNNTGDMLPHPTICNSYFMCVDCPDGGSCVSTHPCPHGMSFQEEEGKCLKGTCTNEAGTFKSGRKPSAKIKQKLINAGSQEVQDAECNALEHVNNNYKDDKLCKCYRRCTLQYEPIAGEFTYSMQKLCCGEGKHFDPDSGNCLPGVCTKDVKKN